MLVRWQVDDVAANPNAADDDSPAAETATAETEVHTRAHHDGWTHGLGMCAMHTLAEGRVHFRSKQRVIFAPFADGRCARARARTICEAGACARWLPRMQGATDITRICVVRVRR